MSLALLLAPLALQSASAIGASCIDCHADVVYAYRATGMARALGPIAPGELAGHGPVRAADGSGAWQLGEDAQGPRIRWLPARADPDGVVQRALAFAVGAGRLDRSYVELRRGTRDDAPGYWHFAALELVSHGSQATAALAPWASIDPSAALGPALTPECLACHTSTLPPPAYPLHLARGAETWTPTGIDCVACHARAGEHAAWRHADSSGDAGGADPLVTSGSLTRVQRLSVCAGCHLQGDARIELVAGAVAPPAPGADLLAHRAIYVAAEPTEDVGFVSQVERMVLSRCWTSDTSESGMRCESCHDPHRSLDDPSERARVRAACSKCHEDADCATPARDRAARDCASCHMRTTPTFDVAGVAIHDHWIRARPGPPSVHARLRIAESRDGRQRRFDWNLAGVAVPAPDASCDMLAYAKLANDHGFARDRALELSRMEPSGPSRELGMVHHVRAWLFEGAGEQDEARRSYKRALLVDPSLDESRINLALVLARAGKAAEGLALLDDVLARHPFAEGALRNRGVLREALGDPTAAITELEAAHALFPRVAVARALERLYSVRGDAGAAARWRAIAEANSSDR
jgi:predicted CXXCH cytochrome family protein